MITKRQPYRYRWFACSRCSGDCYIPWIPGPAARWVYRSRHFLRHFRFLDLEHFIDRLSARPVFVPKLLYESHQENICCVNYRACCHSYYRWFILLASEFKNLGINAAAAAVFSANLLQWRQIGYFDPAADVKPLLHLWSLGVEEQFYLAWPLTLGLLWRSQKILTPLLVGLAVSFSANAQSPDNRARHIRGARSDVLSELPQHRDYRVTW
jgi:hypothetical protein